MHPQCRAGPTIKPVYALYAWGNFIDETELDRLPAWLDPAVLSGERAVLDENLSIYDTGALPVDGPGTFFEVDGEWVEGRQLTGHEASWRVVRIRIATDGTLESARKFTDTIEAESDFAVDEDPTENPLPVGDVVTVWEDEHGQWDLALIEL